MFRFIIALLPFAFLLLELASGFFTQLTGSREIALTIFMMAWMVTWWIFEILPLGITALIPLVFAPMAGLIKLNDISVGYSNPVIYLFLGGFMLARALEKTRLNERIALIILTWTGHSDKGIVLGFILATAFLSMWISNTATAVMMLPIAVSVMAFLQTQVDESEKQYLRPMSVAIYLSIAYAANIGGVVTPIGTPPNVVFVGYLEQLYERKIEFWRWMLVTGPIAIVLLAAQFFILNKLFVYKIKIAKDFRSFVKAKLKNLGPMMGEQKVTLVIFSFVCALWVTKDLIHLLISKPIFNDTSIAILGGLLLFFVPASGLSFKRPISWQPVLVAADITKLPWNIVMLFGGGIALATSLEKVGLIEIVTQYFSTLNLASPYLLILCLTAVALLLTEVMSNVALCVVALPVLMKLGEANGIDPILMALPATIAASFAFTMPISTPPNAIVFGTNEIRMRDMIIAGSFMNILGIITIMTVGWFLVRWLLVV